MTGRTVTRALAVLAALAAVGGPPGAVPVAAAAEVPVYRPAEDATAIRGSSSTANAPQLAPGLHRDTLGRGETKYYAVTLDGTSHAYFSAVAAPKPGTTVEDYRDKLTIRLQDSGGNSCGLDASPSFHGGDTAYPIADYASRRIGSDRTYCQHGGAYYLVVSRTGTATSGPERWPVELSHLTEPALKGTAPPQPPKATGPTVTPAPPTTGTRRAAHGGTGFNDAGAVGDGLWKDTIRAGETRFYRVPVDWGQRLNLSAELPNSASGKEGFLSHAFGLSVHNPARGAVKDDNFVAYQGKPAAATLFTAPVAYGNRLAPTREVSAMRFAGWYYLEVTLHPDAAQYFPRGADLTLRVDVRGRATAGPGYVRPAPEFTVTPEDQESADTGRAARQEVHNGALRTAGYAGIATGAALLAGLGLWTVLARRAHR